MALLVDNDQFARKTYQLTYPNAPYLTEDLRHACPSLIEANAGGHVDILLGCPPCQGFSDTGSRDKDDKRNHHLHRFRLYAEALKPLAVAMENVPLAAAMGVRFRRFVHAMECLGYRATWGILNSALRGSAQCRHRLVYIALREDVGVDPVIAQPTHGGDREYFSYRTRGMANLRGDRISMLSESPGARRTRDLMPYIDENIGREAIPTLDEVIGDLPKVGSPAATRIAHYAWQHTPKMRKRMAGVAEGSRWSGGEDHFSHAYGRLHRQGLARTITTYFSNPGSGRFWHPTEPRALSLREAARIQGFPDSFQFLPEAMNSCRLIGNALDRKLAEVTFDVIRSALE